MSQAVFANYLNVTTSLASKWKRGAPYLIHKGIKAHGARLHNGRLLIPLRDSNGVLHSLQYIIDAEGKNKRFLTGGQKSGNYFSIGNPAETLCIAEGFATGASLHEATAYAVAVAFDSGNQYIPGTPRRPRDLKSLGGQAMTSSGGKSSLELIENEGDSFSPLPTSKVDLRSPVALRRELASLYRDARSGKLDPGAATKLAYLLELLRKSFETADLYERLKLLEKSQSEAFIPESEKEYFAIARRIARMSPGERSA